MLIHKLPWLGVLWSVIAVLFCTVFAYSLDILAVNVPLGSDPAQPTSWLLEYGPWVIAGEVALLVAFTLAMVKTEEFAKSRTHHG